MPYFGLKNVPPGEKVLLHSEAGNCYGTIVVTDKAWYLGGAGLFRPDLSKARRYPWEELRSITIRSPLWLFFVACVGIRLDFSDGERVSFIHGELVTRLELGKQFNVRVDHYRKWFDNPRTFRLRQFLGLLTSLAILWTIFLWIAAHHH